MLSLNLLLHTRDYTLHLQKAIAQSFSQKKISLPVLRAKAMPQRTATTSKRILALGELIPEGHKIFQQNIIKKKNQATSNSKL